MLSSLLTAFVWLFLSVVFGGMYSLGYFVPTKKKSEFVSTLIFSLFVAISLVSSPVDSISFNGIDVSEKTIVLGEGILRMMILCVVTIAQGRLTQFSMLKPNDRWNHWIIWAGIHCTVALIGGVVWTLLQ